MSHTIYTQWMGDMQFNTLINDHTIIMDAPEKAGGHDQGPIPKPLILTALSGCTGMDVIALLKKKKITLQSFQIHVEGHLTKRHPLQYEGIHLVYEVEASPDCKEEVLNAILTSQESLCGVSAMLKKSSMVTWEIAFNKEIIFNNAIQLLENHV